MYISHTVESLIGFEEEVAEMFSNKEILAPIHLDNGNEQQLISIFKDIQDEDWVCGSWRQHYHCLLKGVPGDLLKTKIREGKSIGLQFPDYRVISSAIVAGIIPLALGLAYSIKLKGENNRVWCFVGDQTAQTGTFLESFNYSINLDLPITWVIEDNNKSVCSTLGETWGVKRPNLVNCLESNNYEWDCWFGYHGVHRFSLVSDRDESDCVVPKSDRLIYYTYTSKYPHSGPSGKRIQF